MKILLIHNYYKQAGGEDAVFQSEGELLSAHGHFVERLVFDNKTIKTFSDKLISVFRSIYNPVSARALRKRIELFGPDVIHVHNFVPLASPSIFFVAQKANIPIILTLHNYRLICPSATLFHKGEIYEKSIHSLFPIDAIIKGVYRNSSMQTAVVVFMVALHHILGTWKNRVDCYISLSYFAKEKFLRSSLSLPEKKVVVKPNAAVDYGVGETVREDFFLFVGRLVEEKGIRTLLRATKLHDFKLFVIGEGPLSGEVETYAQSNSNIRYLGFQDKGVIISYMKACRALIFPSLWYEGFPLTILEAFSTGTVVIASRLGLMAEIIHDQTNGLHFEAGDERDLVSKIADLLVNDDKVRSMSYNARKIYLLQYTPERNYELLSNIYTMAIEQKSTIHHQMASVA